MLGAQGDAAGGGEGQEGERGGDREPEQHIAVRLPCARRDQPAAVSRAGPFRRRSEGRHGARLATPTARAARCNPHVLRAISISVCPNRAARWREPIASNRAADAGGRPAAVAMCRSRRAPRARARALLASAMSRRGESGTSSGVPWIAVASRARLARCSPRPTGCQSPGSMATSAPPGVNRRAASAKQGVRGPWKAMWCRTRR